MTTTMTTTNTTTHSSTQLVPAFLKQEDYPPEWKVYHPLLGVVSKIQADAYDQQLLTENDRNTINLLQQQKISKK